VKSVGGGVRKLAKFIVSTFIRAAGGTQLVGINSSKLSHELALKNRVNIHMASNSDSNSTLSQAAYLRWLEE
jgi:hypothetical protein